MEETSKTKFNMASASLQRLDELLRASIFYYRKGDVRNFFFALKNVKLQSMFKFKQKERKMLRQIEKAYSDKSNYLKRWAILELYQEKLMDLMDKYGLLLPNQDNEIRSAY